MISFEYYKMIGAINNKLLKEEIWRSLSNNYYKLNNMYQTNVCITIRGRMLREIEDYVGDIVDPIIIIEHINDELNRAI